MIDKFYAINDQKALVIEVKDDTATCLFLPENDRALGVTLQRVSVSELKPYVCPETNESMYYCKGGVCCYPVLEGASVSCLTVACQKCFIKTWEEMK